MNMKLMRLTIENFKGIRAFELTTNGGDVQIKGRNGAGKTTVYDAFLYMLFGKDSTGRKDFENRPIDENNQPVKGLTLAVEAELEIDGVSHVFRKQQVENVVKKEIRGYSTECYIDEVPKKVGEYDAAISELLSEDTFKLLTDLRYFCGKMKWQDRRQVLLAMAGDIKAPAGFDELVTLLNGRTMDEYRKVLAERKKRHEKDRDEINPRIDEIRRAMVVIPQKAESKEEAEELRKGFQSELAGIAQKRKGFMADDGNRQKHIDALNAVKMNAMRRETELAKETGISPKYLTEKNEIEKGLMARNRKVGEIKDILSELERQKTNHLRTIAGEKMRLEDVRKEYLSVKDAKDDDVCYACGQKLPADKLAALAQKKQDKLNELSKRGSDCKVAVQKAQLEIDELDKQINAGKVNLEHAEIEVRETEEHRATRFAEIDALIVDSPAKRKEDDPIWLKIQAEIENLEKTTPPSVMEQVTALDVRQTEIQGYITEINTMLAQADRMKADTKRIAELEAEEKRLSQAIADVERLLAMIGDYTAAESRIIEETINGMFEHVEFKLFNTLLNGSIEPCCVAMLNGVPYEDCSYGQKILMGVDIINTLSKCEEGISIPLFVDNAESLTLAINPSSQVIKLYADPKAAKLTITQTKKEEVQNVA